MYICVQIHLLNVYVYVCEYLCMYLIFILCLFYNCTNLSLDFEECAHKLLKMTIKPGQEVHILIYNILTPPINHTHTDGGS